MYGHDFVELGAWARTKSLRLSWDSKTKVVSLTNRWTRLRGAISSRQIEINGVKTWLSVPITQRNQNLYISALDLRTLLDPVLIPIRNKPGQRVRVIALDAGHGGKDPGFEVAQRQEKVLTLLLAKKLKTLLEQAGLRVILTRSQDTYVEFDERVGIAKRARADVFVSLHYNSAGSGSTEAKGIETYCITPAGVPSTNAQPDEPGSTKAVLGNLQNHRSILLAYHVHKQMVTSLPVEDRGVRRARFAVLRNAEMPALLIEGGFLTASDEARRIVSVEYRNTLARAIADGVLAYKRLVERR
jgi:N-acetylmuramoyl-L-alanine amidase